MSRRTSSLLTLQARQAFNCPLTPVWVFAGRFQHHRGRLCDGQQPELGHLRGGRLAGAQLDRCVLLPGHHFEGGLAEGLPAVVRALPCHTCMSPACMHVSCLKHMHVQRVHLCCLACTLGGNGICTLLHSTCRIMKAGYQGRPRCRNISTTACEAAQGLFSILVMHLLCTG